MQIEDTIDEVETEGEELHVEADEASQDAENDGEAEGEGQEVSLSDGAPDDMGLVIDLTNEPAEDDEPVGIRNLRARVKELTAKVKEYEKTVPAVQAEALPPEPQLEDFDYDTEAFKRAHKDWVVKSLEHEREQEAQRKLAEQVEQRWQQKITRYEEGRTKLGAKDYDDAEAVVTEILAKPFIGVNAPDVRLNVIKNVAADPNAVIYALGKNEAAAAKLAEIDDVTAFAYEVGKLEAKMTINRGGKKPAPERKVGGTVPGVAGAMDNTLERLRAEAEKTGDYSKVTRYKREKGLRG